MEARAHHFLVGIFVLGLGSALVAFTLWVAKVQMVENRLPYYIHFDGAVTGLKEGSPVRYRGILVGTVAEVRIDPDDVERIRVKVSLEADTPIKTDATAALEMSGLTGSGYVQITGGSRDAPLIERHGDQIPDIPSKTSGLTEVMDAAPHLAHQVSEIGDRLTRLLSPENERRIAESLANLHQMSVDLAASARNVSDTMTLVKSTAAHMDGLMSDLHEKSGAVIDTVNTTLDKMKATLDKVDGRTDVVTAEVVRTSTEARALSQSLHQLSDELSDVIKENRVPVRDFTSVGLYELSLLISEMRELTTSLSRVSSQIEKGPMEFLFTGSRTEPDKK
jgi:phospholipid/cholesterol/gamma-HCH transport system substrate-binding protein